MKVLNLNFLPILSIRKVPVAIVKEITFELSMETSGFRSLELQRGVTKCLSDERSTPRELRGFVLIGLSVYYWEIEMWVTAQDLISKPVLGVHTNLLQCAFWHNDGVNTTCWESRGWVEKGTVFGF